MRETLEKKCVKEAVTQIMSVVNSTYMNSEEYENADNFRIARASDPEEIKAYELAFLDGCCGFYDTLVMVEGRHGGVEAFLLGFNYGH